MRGVTGRGEERGRDCDVSGWSKGIEGVEGVIEKWVEEKLFRMSTAMGLGGMSL